MICVRNISAQIDDASYHRIHEKVQADRHGDDRDVLIEVKQSLRGNGARCGETRLNLLKRSFRKNGVRH